MRSHHAGRGFQNPYLPRFKKSLSDLLKMRFGSSWSKHEQFAHEVPICSPNLSEIMSPTSSLQVTWIGHSTFLIQVEGTNILTDPVFSERASPVSFAGPRRYTAPALTNESLPKIDLVLISHNHYDHLDVNSIRALGNSCKWIVPLGNAKHLASIGINNTTELDWWEQVEFSHLKVTATPAQHWSARTLFDRCDALWSGWSLGSSNHQIYFAGDTGYNNIQFKEIGRELGPFDLGLIPIGAYEPRWFMKDMHVNPDEAIKIHQDVRCKHSIGMHWGTFPLTAEHPNQPPFDLDTARKAAGIDASSFSTMRVGETRRFE